MVENTKKEENIFEKDAEAVTETVTDEEQIVLDSVAETPELVAPEEEVEYEISDFSDQPQYDVKFNEADTITKDDIVLLKDVVTITEVIVPPPIMKDATGKFIPAKPFNPKNPDAIGYKVKMQLKYSGVGEKYISILSNVRWYAGVDKNTGKRVLSPWIDTRISKETCRSDKKSTVSKLYYKYCMFKNLEPGKVLAKEFREGLVGMKVQLEQWSDVYEGNNVFRVDIHSFVE